MIGRGVMEWREVDFGLFHCRASPLLQHSSDTVQVCDVYIMLPNKNFIINSRSC